MLTPLQKLVDAIENTDVVDAPRQAVRLLTSNGMTEVVDAFTHMLLTGQAVLRHNRLRGNLLLWVGNENLGESWFSVEQKGLHCIYRNLHSVD